MRRIPPVEHHLLPSSHVAQTFKVQVMQPAHNRGETTRFPVVYVSDGNLAFDVAKGIAYSIQRSQQDAPRFIVVGIGYPGDSPLSGSVLRMRDLTFPRYPRPNARPTPAEGVLVPQSGMKEYSGAEDFQQFLTEELFTFIDEKYRTIPADRTFFGHSLGGGFGLYTLFTKPDLFRNYIISSPGLMYWGDPLAGTHYEKNELLFEYARKFLRSGMQLSKTRLYLSVGEQEEFEPEIVAWQLTSSFYRMTALIKAAAIPGLELFTEVFPRETHMTVWPMAFTHGVQAVFGTGQWQKDCR